MTSRLPHRACILGLTSALRRACVPGEVARKAAARGSTSIVRELRPKPSSACNRRDPSVASPPWMDKMPQPSIMHGPARVSALCAVLQASPASSHAEMGRANPALTRLTAIACCDSIPVRILAVALPSLKISIDGCACAHNMAVCQPLSGRRTRTACFGRTFDRVLG